MLSAWSASFLAGMTRISREMNHRACRERRRSLLPTMRLWLLPSHSFRHSRFTLANRITSLLPTMRELSRHLLPNLSETHLFWGLFMLALFVDFYCAFSLAAT
jgi:hypothetical protein